VGLREIRKKGARFIVGLASGTSCDGVDAALVRIKGTGEGLVIKLVDFQAFPYPPGLRLRLLAPRIDALEVCALNFEVGEHMADAANAIIKSAHEALHEVDLIASSGHTLAHLPPRLASNGAVGTLQIGEPAVIAERCSFPVISDFGQRDMAAGGQGSPLLSYADWLLFHRDDRTVACLNIGGIVNLSAIPPRFEDMLAFDTGPGNLALDGAVRLLTTGNRMIDNNGEAAAEGMVIDEFLDYLLSHPYFSQVPPKSTGRENFGAEVYLRDALSSRRTSRFEDLMATVTSAVAYSIVRALNRFIKPQFEISRLIVSGGGAHNTTLLDRIKQGLPDLVFRSSTDYGIPIDARKAVAVAILGNETICETPANVPSASGARRRVILGKITPQ
jgi:anhydro-N-acetylmuramic acid kinase